MKQFSASNTYRLFERAAQHASRYRDNLVNRSPWPKAAPDQIERLFDGPTPEAASEAAVVLDALAAAAEAGITAPSSPRFFGWVIGGSHPVGVAADMMTSAWGQNVAGYACSPAGATAEKIASRWLLDLLGLPAESSIGFVSGATMAGFTCLAAARNEVLSRVAWDVEREGLCGAPRITVVAGSEVHATIRSALRYLGLGSHIREIDTDVQGRMDVGHLERALSTCVGPAIVVAGAGQIHTGAFDHFAEIAAICEKRGAWLHVDGAFGLWARLLPEKSDLLAGIEKADSWSVDGHKSLQLPYDSGFAIVKDRAAHARAMSIRASYLAPARDDEHDPSQYVPELSRRARGFPVWAMLRTLGRQGLAEMVRTHCDLASQFAELVSAEPGIRVVNDVVLNQVILAFGDEDDAFKADENARRVIEAIHTNNRFLALGAEWKGRRILRVSITSFATDADTILLLSKEIIGAWRHVRDASQPSVDGPRPDSLLEVS